MAQSNSQLAPEESLRPEPRDIVSSAPKVSPRPEERPVYKPAPRDPFKAKAVREELARISGEKYGDTEFWYDLNSSGSQDIVSYLGFDATKGETQMYDGGFSPFYAIPRGLPRSDDKVWMQGTFDKPVWNHEYRHRGMYEIANTLTAKEVSKELGDVGVDFYNILRGQFMTAGKGRITLDFEKISELLTEMWDRPTDNTPTIGERAKKFAGVPKMDKMGGSISFDQIGTFQVVTKDHNIKEYSPYVAKKYIEALAIMTLKKKGRVTPVERKENGT